MKVHPMSQNGASDGNSGVRDPFKTPTHKNGLRNSPTQELNGDSSMQKKRTEFVDKSRASPGSSRSSFDTTSSRVSVPKNASTPLIKTKVETTAVREAEKKISDIQSKLASLGSKVVNQV
jgi:hypothetical protein